MPPKPLKMHFELKRISPCYFSFKTKMNRMIWKCKKEKVTYVLFSAAFLLLVAPHIGSALSQTVGAQAQPWMTTCFHFTVMKAVWLYLVI